MFLDRLLAYPEGDGDAPGRNRGRVQQKGAHRGHGVRKEARGTPEASGSCGHNCDSYRTERQVCGDRGSWSQQG